jgi:hypothetical protein
LKLQEIDAWYAKVKTSLENEVMRIPKYEGYTLDNDGLLRFHGRIYVSPNE